MTPGSSLRRSSSPADWGLGPIKWFTDERCIPFAAAGRQETVGAFRQYRAHRREGDLTRVVDIIQGKVHGLDDQYASSLRQRCGPRARQKIGKWARGERIQAMVHPVAIDVQQLSLFIR